MVKNIVLAILFITQNLFTKETMIKISSHMKIGLILKNFLNCLNVVGNKYKLLLSYASLIFERNCINVFQIYL